ncbi:MAG: TetR/AcrR family transcriptional regulator [Pseudomonadota bacterium]
MPVLRPEFPDHGSPFSREQERRRKEAAILTAAARRFDEHGFAHTRLEDVAADLGLTKTSISYYFTGKEELAEAVYRASAEILHDAVDAAASASGDAATRLERLFAIYAEELREASEGRRPYLAALRDLDALSEEARTSVTARVSDCVSGINAMVMDWIDQSGAALGRPEPVTFLILALLDWLGERQSAPVAQDREADCDTLLDLVCHGLLAGPTERLAPSFVSVDADDAPGIFDRDARNRMKREAFMKAGARLFNQKGYGGVSLAEVAASLGVSRGAFYYHIPDKEQFLDQCLDRSLQVVETTLDHAEADETAPLTFVRRGLIELIYRQAAGLDPLLRPSLAAILGPARQRRHKARMRNISRRIGDALTEASACGEGRMVDTVVVEDIMASVMFLNGGYTLTAANSFSSWNLSEDPRTAAADYVYLLFHGLRGAAR